MPDLDLVIRNGTVVTAADSFRADVGVRAGRIVALAEELPRGAREIDAAGRLGPAWRGRQPLPHRAALGDGHLERRRLRVNTVDHLAAFGIHDRPLERLRRQVLARTAADAGHRV